jgi:hypothetical protein
MIVTMAYMYGSYNEKWEFGPYWLSACVILDVVWMQYVSAFITGGPVEPLVSIEAGGNSTK